MDQSAELPQCEGCRVLREELTRCRTRLDELEDWKKRYEVWKSSWNFRCGLLIGFLLISLIANVASLAMR